MGTAYYVVMVICSVVSAQDCANVVLPETVPGSAQCMIEGSFYASEWIQRHGGGYRLGEIKCSTEPPIEDEPT
jgi:hypothetical protein